MKNVVIKTITDMIIRIKTLSKHTSKSHFKNYYLNQELMALDSKKDYLNKKL